MYKCKLNELCQKRGYEAPTYSCFKFGQDHNPLYKAQVIVNGSTFKSSTAFKNHKSADNDVAEVAYSHFITFSRPIDVMQKGKKLKGGCSLSLSSDFNTGALDETGESSLPILPNDEEAKVASFDHSDLSIIEPNCIVSIIIEPNRIMSLDTDGITPLWCKNKRRNKNIV